MIPGMAPEVVLLITAVLLLALWAMSRTTKNFPPGPRNWQLFRAIPLTFQFRLKDEISSLHKKYGRVVGLHVLNIPVVIISGHDEVREALLRDDFAGRPEISNLGVFGGQKMGIILASGEKWKLQRRFALQHLRQLGFGKSSLEGIIHEEIRAMMDGIEELSGGCENGYPYPVDFKFLLGAASINVLWHIVTGRRFDYKDNEFKQLMEAAKLIFDVISQRLAFHNLFPILEKLFPSTFRIADYEICTLCVRNAIERELNSHKQSIDYDHPRDFIDIYLCEIEKQKKDLPEIFNEPINLTIFHEPVKILPLNVGINTTTASLFQATGIKLPKSACTKNQLKVVCSEFFLAGTDTTSNTLSFAILYMILYPEAQRKAQKEIDEVVGKERLPSLSDRPRLPYLEAIIQEVLRLSSVAPATFPHSVMTSEEYVTFRDYHIPKGSYIIMDLYGVHHDPEVWKCPNMFIPERFLKKNEKVVSNEVIFPFSAGKRGCPGESLARNNIFLILASILQRYTLKVPDGQPQPSTEPDGYTALFPKHFMVKVQRRF